MTNPTEIAMWSQITGLNVTAIRRVPTTRTVDTTVDGQQLTASDRVELQIDGHWPESLGVYQFNPAYMINPAANPPSDWRTP